MKKQVVCRTEILERQRRRWEDNIRMDLKAIGTSGGCCDNGNKSSGIERYVERLLTRRTRVGF